MKPTTAPEAPMMMRLLRAIAAILNCRPRPADDQSPLRPWDARFRFQFYRHPDDRTKK